MRTVVLGGVVVAALFIVAGYVGFNLLPFGTETKDHSPPPILQELRELADFHGAQAEFEVIVDSEEDVRFMPQFLAGERVQFVAIGTVDAVVDLSTLSSEAIRFDEETNSVTVLLPAPKIDGPVIDHEQSHVMNRDRGLFNRLGGLFSDSPTGERDLYLAAESKMSDAAARTGLVAMAEKTTAQLLEDMILNMGVDDADVRFYDGELPECEGPGCS